ncbi:hypothetical protein [Draconibacterium sediminis]|nr:hypothetical protein [Draconibacterium sediminis]
MAKERSEESSATGKLFRLVGGLQRNCDEIASPDASELDRDRNDEEKK